MKPENNSIRKSGTPSSRGGASSGSRRPPENKGESGRENRKKDRKPMSSGMQLFWRVMSALLMLGIIAGCLLTCYLAIFVFDTLESDQYILDLDVKKLEYTTILYAQDPVTGEISEITRLYSPDANRIWVDYERMPQVLIDTVVAVEDKRFFDHNGVDWQRTVLSGINYAMQKVGLSGFYQGTPGASTLTQQVVRNITEDDSYDTARKTREIFRALKLEKSYSKDQIVEAYLNTVPFGNETYGIQAAANFYFNKDVGELTAAECASIIGTTKDPTYYNPYRNFDNNQKRKDDILFLMNEQGMLNEAEYRAALDEEIVFSTENNKNRIEAKQSYFVDYVIERVIRGLQAKLGCEYKEAERKLYTGGYRIYTTVDMRVQTGLENIYLNWEETFPTSVRNAVYPQSAFIMSDPNGKIIAMVGGKGEKEGARVWNRATDTNRQVGSTIKPISSYALAFDSDLIHWSTLIEDKAVVIVPDPARPEQVWRPRNYYLGYKGYMTVDEAVQRSTNMIPVQLTQLLTPRALWNFMHDSLHMNSLVQADIAYSPMALGSLTNGVTPLEMLGAYQMFANGGTRTEPYAYTKVLDSTGAVVLENIPTPQRVISYETASVMNKLLQRVTTGPVGTGYNAKLSSGIPVAGKTGTTDEDVDQWFIGITPYYVGVCWMGYDDQYQTTINETTGQKEFVLDRYGNRVPNTIVYGYYPPPMLWKTVMEMAHQGLDYKDFTYSSEIVSIRYCALTGYAATPDCPNTVVGWYKPMNIPSNCPYHGGYYTEYDIPLVGTYSYVPVPEDEEER